MLYCNIWIFVGFSVAGIPMFMQASWPQFTSLDMANIDLHPSALLGKNSWCHKLQLLYLSGNVGRKCVKALGVQQMGSIDDMQSAALRHWDPEPGSSYMSCSGARSRINAVEFSWQCC